MSAIWGSDEDEFNLLIYSVPPGFAAKGVAQDDVAGWLTRHGTLCSGQRRVILDKYCKIAEKPISNPTATEAALSIPRPKLLPLFKCIRRVLGVDLLPLVGATDADDAIEEDDLCLGSIQHELVNVTVIKVRSLLEPRSASTDAGTGLNEENEEIEETEDESKRRARLAEVRRHAKDFKLDPDWFLESLARLADALDESTTIHNDNITMGLLE